MGPGAVVRGSVPHRHYSVCPVEGIKDRMGGASQCHGQAGFDVLSWATGRTLIFTTHHLDEAEALSDCVAVLQHGRLRCWAPPSCLTEVYGQGLSLTLTRQVRNTYRGHGHFVRGSQLDHKHLS